MRNNEERFGARPSADTPVPQMANPMDFVKPTEFVELPSKGKMYPQGHPLYDEETLEIHYMTAKDEDILTSRSLLKKGLALDRLIQNLVVDKTIRAQDLLIGDRNAILIAARASAYGHIYDTNVTCPACGEKSKHKFNLLEPTVEHGGEWEEEYQIEQNAKGNYIVKLPYTELLVEIRMLTGVDEIQLVKETQKNNRKEMEASVTSQMKKFIVSVNGYTEMQAINHVINNITAKETRHLRNAYKQLAPDLKITSDFECMACNNEQELEVPFNTDFFWPDR